MGTVASSIGQCSGCQTKQRRRRSHGRAKNGQGAENFTLLAYYNSFIASNALSPTSQHCKDVDRHHYQNGHWPHSVNYHKGISDKQLSYPSGDSALSCQKNRLCYRLSNEIRPSPGEAKSDATNINHAKNSICKNPEASKKVLDQNAKSSFTVNNNPLSDLDCGKLTWLTVLKEICC